MEGAFETVGSIAFEIAYYLIMFLEYAMLARAILSWFLDEESRILGFLMILTEPIILPFRLLFRKLNWFQEMPLDMSFLFAVVFLGLAGYLLQLFAA